jgi:hypothetical protein
MPKQNCLNDNTAGGVIDILKYHKEGSEELMRGVQGYRVIDVAGARFIETTTASTFANFPSGTKTGYGTYVVGQDAVFSVSLGATEIPEQRNYQLIVRNWEPSVADPARVVGASCALEIRAVPKEFGYDSCLNSGELPQGQSRAKPMKIGTCRDYVGNIREDEDIVRSAWQHAELDGNDLARREASNNQDNFKYAAMRVPQSAALHPRFRLNQIGPLQSNLEAINAQSRWNPLSGDNAEPSRGNTEGVETVWALPLAG